MKRGLVRAFAAVMRRRRVASGMSQEALAEAAELHRTYVGLLERGLRTPTIDVAERIARALSTRLSLMIAEAERRNRR